MSSPDAPATGEASARDPHAERALLRRFEPVLRYTRGERFFPMDVDSYIRQCSLWVQRPGSAPECAIHEGELTPERLAEARSPGFDAVTYLQFIEPLNIAEMARYSLEETKRRREAGDVFRAGRGRLSRVGFMSRLVDALFSLTLFARGRVPGDTAAAAALTYRKLVGPDPEYLYYGRVIDQNGWVVLQYWFFYPYNNWRSGFFGVNDHEADWEQICVYLYADEGGELHPAWVAYASHDFTGDDLRRRWDDPELETVGEHPVVYVGAGSHASYYRRGEYLAEIELRFMAPLARLAERLRRMRDEALSEYYQGTDFPLQQQPGEGLNMFRVPFVDYARGDGSAIGPGQNCAWSEPRLLDPVPGWALAYRGLWGLYARDPLSGEDAPAGPVYNRDGSVRRAWYDPLGWAGLDKVPPPGEALAEARARREAVRERREALQQEAIALSDELTELGVELEAMRGQPHLKALFDSQSEAIAAASGRLNDLRRQITEDRALLEALGGYVEALRAGSRGPLRAHITHAHRPIDETERRMGRLADLWAASSIGLLLILLLVIFYSPQSALLTSVVLIGSFLVIDAAFRRWLTGLLTAVTVLLALVAAGILLVEFLRPIAIGAVALLALYLLIDNLRELWT